MVLIELIQVLAGHLSYVQKKIVKRSVEWLGKWAQDTLKSMQSANDPNDPYAGPLSLSSVEPLVDIQYLRNHASGALASYQSWGLPDASTPIRMEDLQRLLYEDEMIMVDKDLADKMMDQIAINGPVFTHADMMSLLGIGLPCDSGDYAEYPED